MKHFTTPRLALALLSTGALCLSLAPTAWAVTGSTNSSAESAAKAIDETPRATLAAQGLEVNGHFTSAGTITVTVTGPGTSGHGSATDIKAGDGTITVAFTKLGKTGTTVTVTVTFKPSGGKGDSSTSTETATLA